MGHGSLCRTTGAGLFGWKPKASGKNHLGGVDLLAAYYLGKIYNRHWRVHIKEISELINYLRKCRGRVSFCSGSTIAFESRFKTVARLLAPSLHMISI